MKIIKTKPLLLFTIGILVVGLTHAQESVNASGGDASSSEGSVAYSIGQVVYTMHSNSDGSIAQGVQQVYEISDLGIKETTFNITLTAFPNPTVDNLTLQISNYNDETLIYHVYGTEGKLLDSGKVESEQTTIGMRSLPASTYYVHVLNSEKQKVQSFKIIKN